MLQGMKFIASCYRDAKSYCLRHETHASYKPNLPNHTQLRYGEVNTLESQIFSEPLYVTFYLQDELITYTEPSCSSSAQMYLSITNLSIFSWEHCTNQTNVAYLPVYWGTRTMHHPEVTAGLSFVQELQCMWKGFESFGFCYMIQFIFSSLVTYL